MCRSHEFPLGAMARSRRVRRINVPSRPWTTISYTSPVRPQTTSIGPRSGETADGGTNGRVVSKRIVSSSKMVCMSR